VALAFMRDQVRHTLTGSGFVVPRVEHTGILAASWLSSKWPNRAPEGRVLMRTFLGGARDPQAIERSDAELIQTSLAALRPPRHRARPIVHAGGHWPGQRPAYGSPDGWPPSTARWRDIRVVPDGERRQHTGCIADGRKTGRARYMVSVES
jgi:hypothetical protein